MMIAFCLVCGLALALLPHLIWFLGWVIARIAGGHLPYHCFGWSALGLVLVFWGSMAYGYFIGRWNLEVTHLDYIHEDIPEAFEGFKIVHISDLHLSTFEETHGRYDRDGQTLYINIGLGCTAPFRIGARPEITVIRLGS